MASTDVERALEALKNDANPASIATAAISILNVAKSSTDAAEHTTAVHAVVPFATNSNLSFMQRAQISKNLAVVLRAIFPKSVSPSSSPLFKDALDAFFSIIENVETRFHASEVRVATDTTLSILSAGHQDGLELAVTMLVDRYLSNGGNGASFAAAMHAASQSADSIPFAVVEQVIVNDSRLTDEQRQRFLSVLPQKYAGKGNAVSHKALVEVQEAPLPVDTAANIEASIATLQALLSEDLRSLKEHSSVVALLTLPFLRKCFEVAIAARRELTDPIAVARAERVVTALLVYAELSSEDANTLAAFLHTETPFFAAVTVAPTAEGTTTTAVEEAEGAAQVTTDSGWQRDVDLSAVELRLLVAKKLFVLANPATATAEGGGATEGTPNTVTLKEVLVPFCVQLLPVTEEMRKKLPRGGRVQKRQRQGGDHADEPAATAAEGADQSSSCGPTVEYWKRCAAVINAVVFLCRYFSEGDARQVIPSWMK